MTYLEKLKETHPNYSDDHIYNILTGDCPDQVFNCANFICRDENCFACWQREIPEVTVKEKENEEMNTCKETLCTTCIHREVCSMKESYLAAVDAVDNMKVNFDDGSVQYLHNMTWIRPVRLECRYYTAPALTVRSEQ